ncbi:MRG domain-containing protein [Ditylenchus destructor]|uniref:MRG domain-containing protein n=1 Tax=Ditylenchus destructor TaxID=166010 RepID=A0AAD4N156_9BILA|nr:MRG domain-containing protein [Ditylenchus destructor]
MLADDDLMEVCSEISSLHLTISTSDEEEREAWPQSQNGQEQQQIQETPQQIHNHLQEREAWPQSQPDQEKQQIQDPPQQVQDHLQQTQDPLQQIHNHLQEQLTIEPEQQALDLPQQTHDHLDMQSAQDFEQQIHNHLQEQLTIELEQQVEDQSPTQPTQDPDQQFQETPRTIRKRRSSRPIKVEIDEIDFGGKLEKVKLTMALQKVLDWEICLPETNLLHSVPARYSIKNIVNKYFKTMTTSEDEQSRIFGAKLMEQFNLQFGKHLVSGWEAPMYEDLLSGNVLYYGPLKHKPKYLKSVQLEKEKDGSLKMSSLFGLPKLLQLLSIIHEKVTDPADVTLFVRHMDGFVGFLDNFHDEFFDSENDLYPSSTAYFTKYCISDD